MKSYRDGGLDLRRYVIFESAVEKYGEGSLIPIKGAFFVLDIGGSDKHALKALAVYAESVASENQELSSDLIEFLGTGYKNDKRTN